MDIMDIESHLVQSAERARRRYCTSKEFAVMDPSSGDEVSYREDIEYYRGTGSSRGSHGNSRRGSDASYGVAYRNSEATSTMIASTRFSIGGRPRAHLDGDADSYHSNPSIAVSISDTNYSDDDSDDNNNDDPRRRHQRSLHPSGQTLGSPGLSPSVSRSQFESSVGSMDSLLGPNYVNTYATTPAPMEIYSTPQSKRAFAGSRGPSVLLDESSMYVTPNAVQPSQGSNSNISPVPVADYAAPGNGLRFYGSPIGADSPAAMTVFATPGTMAQSDAATVSYISPLSPVPVTRYEGNAINYEPVHNFTNAIGSQIVPPIDDEMNPETSDAHAVYYPPPPVPPPPLIPGDDGELQQQIHKSSSVYSINSLVSASSMLLPRGSAHDLFAGPPPPPSSGTMEETGVGAAVAVANEPAIVEVLSKDSSALLDHHRCSTQASRYSIGDQLGDNSDGRSFADADAELAAIEGGIADYSSAAQQHGGSSASLNGYDEQQQQKLSEAEKEESSSKSVSYLPTSPEPTALSMNVKPPSRPTPPPAILVHTLPSSVKYRMGGADSSRGGGADSSRGGGADSSHGNISSSGSVDSRSASGQGNATSPIVSGDAEARNTIDGKTRRRDSASSGHGEYTELRSQLGAGLTIQFEESMVGATGTASAFSSPMPMDRSAGVHDNDRSLTVSPPIQDTAEDLEAVVELQVEAAAEQEENIPQEELEYLPDEDPRGEHSSSSWSQQRQEQVESRRSADQTGSQGGVENDDLTNPQIQVQPSSELLVPEGWAAYTTEEGWVYYYNEATGVSSWLQPNADGSIPTESNDDNNNNSLIMDINTDNATGDYDVGAQGDVDGIRNEVSNGFDGDVDVSLQVEGSLEQRFEEVAATDISIDPERSIEIDTLPSGAPHLEMSFSENSRLTSNSYVDEVVDVESETEFDTRTENTPIDTDFMAMRAAGDINPEFDVSEDVLQPVTPSGTLLHHFARQCSLEGLQQMLTGVAMRVDVDNRNPFGETPLLLLCGQEYCDDLDQCAEFLLSQGADPNAHAADGTTPLHRCVTHGNAATIEVLLRAGADPNSPSLSADAEVQDTPLQLAARIGQFACMQAMVLRAPALAATNPNTASTTTSAAAAQRVFRGTNINTNLPAPASSTLSGGRQRRNTSSSSPSSSPSPSALSPLSKASPSLSTSQGQPQIQVPSSTSSSTGPVKRSPMSTTTITVNIPANVPNSNSRKPSPNGTSQLRQSSQTQTQPHMTTHTQVYAPTPRQQDYTASGHSVVSTGSQKPHNRSSQQHTAQRHFQQQEDRSNHQQSASAVVAQKSEKDIVAYVDTDKNTKANTPNSQSATGLRSHERAWQQYEESKKQTDGLIPMDPLDFVGKARSGVSVGSTESSRRRVRQGAAAANNASNSSRKSKSSRDERSRQSDQKSIKSKGNSERTENSILHAAGWVELYSAEGYPYYYHEESQHVQWEHPLKEAQGEDYNEPEVPSSQVEYTEEEQGIEAYESAENIDGDYQHYTDLPATSRSNSDYDPSSVPNTARLQYPTEFGEIDSAVEIATLSMRGSMRTSIVQTPIRRPSISDLNNRPPSRRTSEAELNIDPKVLSSGSVGNGVRKPPPLQVVPGSGSVTGTAIGSRPGTSSSAPPTGRNEYPYRNASPTAASTSRSRFSPATLMGGPMMPKQHSPSQIRAFFAIGSHPMMQGDAHSQTHSQTHAQSQYGQQEVSPVKAATSAHSQFQYQQGQPSSSGIAPHWQTAESWMNTPDRRHSTAAQASADINASSPLFASPLTPNSPKTPASPPFKTPAQEPAVHPQTPDNSHIVPLRRRNSASTAQSMSDLSQSDYEEDNSQATSLKSNERSAASSTAERHLQVWERFFANAFRATEMKAMGAAVGASSDAPAVSGGSDQVPGTPSRRNPNRWPEKPSEETYRELLSAVMPQRDQHKKRHSKHDENNEGKVGGAATAGGAGASGGQRKGSRIDGNALSRALIAAVMRGDFVSAEGLLLLGANPSCVDEEGRDVRAPAHFAARYNDVKTLALLYDHGADLESTDFWGRRPLHVAAIFGSTEALQFLLESAVEVTATDSTGSTPLHFAARGGHVSCCRLLVDFGAPLDALNSQGLDPLRCAKAVQPRSSELAQVALVLTAAMRAQEELDAEGGDRSPGIAAVESMSGSGSRYREATDREYERAPPSKPPISTNNKKGANIDVIAANKKERDRERERLHRKVDFADEDSTGRQIDAATKEQNREKSSKFARARAAAQQRLSHGSGSSTGSVTEDIPVRTGLNQFSGDREQEKRPVSLRIDTSGKHHDHAPDGYMDGSRRSPVHKESGVYAHDDRELETRARNKLTEDDADENEVDDDVDVEATDSDDTDDFKDPLADAVWGVASSLIGMTLNMFSKETEKEKKNRGDNGSDFADSREISRTNSMDSGAAGSRGSNASSTTKKSWWGWGAQTQKADSQDSTVDQKSRSPGAWSTSAAPPTDAELYSKGLGFHAQPPPELISADLQRHTAAVKMGLTPRLGNHAQPPAEVTVAVAVARAEWERRSSPGASPARHLVNSDAISAAVAVARAERDRGVPSPSNKRGATSPEKHAGGRGSPQKQQKPSQGAPPSNGYSLGALPTGVSWRYVDVLNESSNDDTKKTNRT